MRQVILRPLLRLVKNTHCDCTTSAFTPELEPGASVSGATLPGPLALEAVSVHRRTVVRSSFLSTVGHPSAVAFGSYLPYPPSENTEVHIQGNVFLDQSRLPPPGDAGRWVPEATADGDADAQDSGVAAEAKRRVLMKKLLRFISGATLIIMVCCLPVEAKAEGGPQASLPLPQIPGVTAPDQFPRGCVDCHVNRPDLKMDVRISTIMRQW
jgi:hypothetical protein